MKNNPTNHRETLEKVRYNNDWCRKYVISNRQLIKERDLIRDFPQIATSYEALYKENEELKQERDCCCSDTETCVMHCQINVLTKEREYSERELSRFSTMLCASKKENQEKDKRIQELEEALQEIEYPNKCNGECRSIAEKALSPSSK